MKKTTIIVEDGYKTSATNFHKTSCREPRNERFSVRNLSNGKVEIFCEADSPKLEEFEQKISYKGKKNDPLSVYVENLAVHPEGEKEYLGPGRNTRISRLIMGLKFSRPLIVQC